jgi:zinc protease
MVHRAESLDHRIPAAEHEAEGERQEMKARLFAMGFAVCATIAPVRAVDVEGLPAAGAAHAAVPIAPREKTLANGLRVIVVERPGLPLLSARLIIKSGAETDPPRLAGLAQFTAELLKRGTVKRRATQIAQDIEALGASIDIETAWDSTTFQLTTLSANAAPALGILAELARQPAFAKDEIERQRRELLDDLHLSLEEPGTVARLAAARVALGVSPYAHPAQGTPESLARFTRKDIVAQHARTFRPGNALLVMAGNVTADEAFALAEQTLGDWAAPAVKALPVGPPPPPSAPRVVLIDMPAAGQAAVFLAAPGIGRGAADWFAGQVANTLLGGGYSSRLNQEVRLKRGLSYGAGSSLATRRTGGLFLATAQTKNESAAEVVKVMQAEITRVITNPAPLEYLHGRQAVLTGAFARDLETNAGYAERLGKLAVYDLPLDGLAHYDEEIDRITPGDLQVFAEKHFAAETFSIVVAGQGKIIEPGLRVSFLGLEVIPATRLDLDTPSLRAARRR